MGYVKGCDHVFANAIDDDTIDAELANRIDNHKAGEQKVDMADTERAPRAYRRYMWKEEYVDRALKPGEFPIIPKGEQWYRRRRGRRR